MQGSNILVNRDKFSETQSLLSCSLSRVKSVLILQPQTSVDNSSVA